MIIRLAIEADLGGVLKLYEQLNPGDKDMDSAVAETRWHELLGREGINFFVVEQGGLLVGTTVLVVVPNLSRGGRPYGLIENVVTDESVRGQGIGKAMMAHVVEAAWEQDCYKVMLLSNAKRAEAHRFYEACGFSGDSKRGFIIRSD